MRLVVDSNVVIAGMLKDGVSRVLLMEAPLEFVSPAHMLEELTKHRTTISRRAQIDENEFDLLLGLLCERIRVADVTEYESKMELANSLIGARDPGDVPFLALAIHLGRAIWTYNPRHFEDSSIPLWGTGDVANYARSYHA